MAFRRTLTALGAGVTTFLLIAVLVIELLYVEFSALVGVPVGLLAGLAVVAGLWQILPELSPAVSRVATAYAVFGLSVLFLFALGYVNVGRELLSLEVMAAVGIGAGIAAYLVLWADDRATAM